MTTLYRLVYSNGSHSAWTADRARLEKLCKETFFRAHIEMWDREKNIIERA